MISDFKSCSHGYRVWNECPECVGATVTQLLIARSYLRELALGTFNDDGIMQKPIAEPVQGRPYQAIAATGLSACSD